MKSYYYRENGLYRWGDLRPLHVDGGIVTYGYMFVEPDDAADFFRTFSGVYSSVCGDVWMLGVTLGRLRRFSSLVEEYSTEKSFARGHGDRSAWRRYSRQGEVSYSRVTALAAPPSDDMVGYAQNRHDVVLFHEAGAARDPAVYLDVLFADPEHPDVRKLICDGYADVVLQLDLEPDTFSAFYAITRRTDLDQFHDLIDGRTTFELIDRDAYVKLYLSGYG